MKTRRSISLFVFGLLVCRLWGAGSALAMPVRQIQDPPSEPPVIQGGGDSAMRRYADLAVGVWGEDVFSVLDGGSVNVLYSAANGLSASGNQIWHQDSTGVQGEPEAEDHFASALAAGDFDDDGYFDLAVGIPAEDMGGHSDAGLVQVLYGEPGGTGLTAARDQYWYQGNGGLSDATEPSDAFGSALAAGDFDGNGYDDLAVGVPFEDLGATNAITAAGAVQILYGSADGLTATESQFWNQDNSGISGVAEAGDQFGFALAAGDLNRDGYTDLAISATGEAIGTLNNAGSVNVLYGSTDGLTAAGNQIWYQDISGVEDASEAGDHFGHALTIGDFDGDGYGDLAVGVPWEDVAETDEGAVHVFYGSVSGLTATDDRLWSEAVMGMTPGEEDLAGYALAAGDFDADHYDDLAVSVPWRDVAYLGNNIGGVGIIYGTAAGLSTVDFNILSQWELGDGDEGASTESGDQFGISLAAGDLNGDRYADLAIGVPYEDIGSVVDAGGVNVAYGSSTGVPDGGHQFWSQNSTGVESDAETDDRFGWALIMGDFDRTYRIFLPLVLRNL